MRIPTGNRRDSEAGVAVLQVAIVIPALLVLIIGGIQVALYLHARNVLTEAAQAGVQGARGQHASAGQGHAAATQLIAQASPHMFSGTSVNVARGGGVVTVTVNASVGSVIPGITLPPVHASARGPVERVTQ